MCSSVYTEYKALCVVNKRFTVSFSLNKTNFTMNDFYPIPDADVHGQFLHDVIDILFKNIVFTKKSDKVVLWKQPADLLNIFDFSLNQSGVSHEQLLTLIKQTIKFSVKTGHPYFINQLFSG